MDKVILGVDAGNYMAKVVGPYGTDKFRTNICDWFVRDVEETFGNDDMEFEINGRKGFAGTIALYEDEFGSGSMYGDTKAHDDTQIRVLLAIYRYLEKYCPKTSHVSVVVGQPIKTHKKPEKERIIKMLEGVHSPTVNSKARSFQIDKVGVAAEGSAAFWSNPMDNEIRIIDCGSSTINAATIRDNKHINNYSGTFNFGTETANKKGDLEGIAQGIIRRTTELKWNKSDKVLICGGSAEGIFHHLVKHFSNAEILKPKYKSRNGVELLNPIYANANAFYEIAKGVFR